MSMDETVGPETPQESTEAEAAPALPSFPTRVIQTFFSPGALGAGLARNPAWGAALALGVVLMLGQMLLIPEEVWQSSFREMMLDRGQELPPNFDAAGSFMRISAVVGGSIGYLVFLALFAGLATLIFAFFMGDEGKFRQYLAVMSHAWLIPAVVGLVLLPLKIMQQDPQLTLNLGSFLFFLEDGYAARVAKMMDFSQAWAWLVVAQGAHAIDNRRSFGSAATVVMSLFVVLALLFALIPGAG